jgi:hypothetical protein
VVERSALKYMQFSLYWLREPTDEGHTIWKGVPFRGWRKEFRLLIFTKGFSRCDRSACLVKYRVSSVPQRIQGLTIDRDA